LRELDVDLQQQISPFDVCQSSIITNIIIIILILGFWHAAVGEANGAGGFGDGIGRTMYVQPLAVDTNHGKG